MLQMANLVRELSRVETRPGATLSLYLEMDPSSGPGANVTAQLAGLVRAARATVPARDWPRLDAELRSVEDQGMPFELPCRSLALFSCAAVGFFRAVPLDVRLAPSIRWGTDFDLMPLVTAMHEHAHVLAVLLDKERARFFLSGAEPIRELEDLWDYVPNKHSQGGYAQANIQRDHDGHVLAHVRRAAATLERLDARQSPRRILAGGPAEALTRLGEELAPALRERFHPVLSLPVIAPTAEVGLKVTEAARALEDAAQERLLDELAEEAGRGMAVFGLDEVLAAVNDLRIALLLIVHGLEIEGGECPACRLLYRAPLPAACPGCGGVLEARADLPGRMALAVLRQGGKVEEIQDGPALRLLSSALAARLRYATGTGGLAATAAEEAG